MKKRKVAPKEKLPRIILLGGIYGVGKTSLAHQLSKDLDIYQRAGLGAVTKTMKALLPKHKIIKEWGKYNSIDPKQIKEKIIRESKLMGTVINNIINSAYKTGEDYVIDGVQLLPQFLPLNKIYFCIITVSDPKEYRKRFEHPTKTRAKHSNNASLATAKIIESVILSEAKKWGVPVIDNMKNLKEGSRVIREYFKLKA